MRHALGRCGFSDVSSTAIASGQEPPAYAIAAGWLGAVT
jgi:hypothetical protein